MTTTNNTSNKTNASLINHDISANLWDCMDDAAPAKKNRLIDRILEHGIEVDTLVTFEGRQVLKTSTGKVYIYNAEKGRASQYEADGTGYTPITVERFNAQVKAAEARIQRDVETSQRIRENVQRYEASTSTDHNSVLLDAEREDSTFDYRQSDEIFGSRTEVESYEETDSLLDEDKADFRGFHVATLVGWENVKGWVETTRDGEQKFHKAYVLFYFDIGGTVISSRAYAKQFSSFKIQMDKTHHQIFRFTRDSLALDELVGTSVDVWVKWNEMLGHWVRPDGTVIPKREYGAKWEQGEWQAEFYDADAYRARKAEEAQAGFVRSGYGRPTERKATR